MNTLQQLLGKSLDIYSEPGSTSHRPTFSRYIKPSLEYCSHIWGAATPTTLAILGVVQRRAIRRIGDQDLTFHLQPFCHRRGVLLVTFHSSTDIQTDSAPPSLYNSAALQAC
nr:unnamed protein product [Callosobruchus chinensis]